jgi:hypothetical protein
MKAMLGLRGLPLLALVATGAAAHGAPAEAAQPIDAGTAFHLESKPAIDDVFGDASDYRRTIDRFLELTDSMQSMRDDFARSVQTTLGELQKSEAGRKPGGKHVCPVDAVAGPYARARHLGSEYLRVGRELTRHYEQVKEFDRLGESVGLTPDYRWKVKRVLAHYNTLLTDYREMKVALHDQLNDELKYAGCDLQQLVLKGDPKAAVAQDDSWPNPGQAGAPGVPQAQGSKTDKTVAQAETLPPSLPSEKVPTPQPIPVPARTTAPADADKGPRSGILFYVDNSKCQRGTTVYLDGKKLGDVAAAQRVGFQTVPGPHDLCLLDDAKKQCGAPGTLRRSYMHEGWTISLRCE